MLFICCISYSCMVKAEQMLLANFFFTGPAVQGE